MTYEERKAALVVIAKELAETQIYGVTVEEIRFEAERRGILTGNEQGRELSYLSSIPKAAGLRVTGERVRSSRPGAHGNYQSVWYVDPNRAAVATV